MENIPEDRVLDMKKFNRNWEITKREGGPMLELWRLRSGFSLLTPNDITEWKQCIAKEASSPDTKKSETLFMLKEIVHKYPTSLNYCQLLDAVGNNTSDVLAALHECGSEYLHSQLIWNRFLEHNDFAKNPLALLDMFRLRLRTPHRQIHETFESLSKWVSAHIPDSYNAIMREASILMNETEKTMRYIEKLESSIAESPSDPEAWITYLRKIGKFAGASSRDDMPILNFKTVKQLFLRSLFTGRNKLGDPAWLPVWTEYIRVYERSNATSLQAYYDALSEFCRTYPGCCEAFRPLLRNITSEESFLHFLRELEEPMKSESARDIKTWLLMVEEILGACQRVSGSLLLSLLLNYGQIAATNELDSDHKCFKVIISILQELGLEEALKVAKGLVVDFFEAFATQTDSWLFCFQFFVRHSEKHIKKLLTLWAEDALEIDDSGKLVDEMLRYVRLHGSSSEYLEAMDEAERVEEKLSMKKPTNEEMAIENSRNKNPEMDPASHPEKRIKTDHKEDIPSRSREQFRIQVSPISTDVTEDDVRLFFQGYGEPVSMNIGDLVAIVELGSEQEVMTCLTRDVKPLKGVPVKVSRLFGNTLWVTNYPPEFSYEDISSLVNSFGKSTIDLRLPRQADLKHRRFCYADFSDAESAHFVQTKLNGLMVNNYEVHAEISNPNLRKERKEPPITRQAYLQNLNFKETTEQSLRQLVEKFGDVEAIKLPLSEANQKKGNVNNGYAFVTFTTEAATKEAIALGAAQLDGRRINISPVKSKQNLEKVQVSHFNAASSVSIQNVNEIVTSEQLKAYLESKVGPVSKILLQPSKKAALVEFESFKDAGKVGLVLEGVDYESSILHIGLKEDFVKIHAEGSTPKMVPAGLMRRRRR